MFSCIINRNFSRTLTSVFACLFAVFLGSIFATYMKIFTTIKKAISLGLSATTEQKPSNEIEQEEDVKLDSSKESEKKSNNLTLALSISKGFFINFTFVALSIGPFFVASVFDFDKTWPAYAHLYPYVFFRLCASANPIIYPLFHSSFWKGYKNVYEHVVYSKRRRNARKKYKIVMIKNEKIKRNREIEMKALILQNHLELLAQNQSGENDQNREDMKQNEIIEKIDH